MNIIQSPSKNYSASSHKKIGVQIHKTLGLMPWTLQWLQNPKAYASAHYLIARNGDVHQLVQLGNRSWSAGRFNQPSARAKIILKKDWLGRYIKPGHYLIEIEFECMAYQTYTEKQYESAIELFKTFDFDVTNDNFLTHQDTAIDKPDLEVERTEILRRLEGISEPVVEESMNRGDIKNEIHRLLDKL